MRDKGTSCVLYLAIVVSPFCHGLWRNPGHQMYQANVLVIKQCILCDVVQHLSNVDDELCYSHYAVEFHKLHQLIV